MSLNGWSGRSRSFVVLAVVIGSAVSMGATCRRGPVVQGVCAEGETRCAGDAVETCTSGAWSAAVACPTGESCSLGACSMVGSCVDDCTVAGATACAGGSTVTCGEYDSDACLDLGGAVDCGPGTFCSNGTCAASCTDECTAGTTSCAGPGASQDCDNYDEDDCLDWGGAVACAPGQICVAEPAGGGACMMGSCTDECNPVDYPWTCADAGYTTCTTTGDADPCYEMSVVPCSACAQPNPPLECTECCPN